MNFALLKLKEKNLNNIKLIIVVVVNILIKAIYLAGGIQNLDN